MFSVVSCVSVEEKFIDEEEIPAKYRGIRQYMWGENRVVQRTRSCLLPGGGTQEAK